MSTKIPILFFCTLTLLLTKSLCAQTNIDSLILVSETSQSDSVVNKALLDICWALKASDPDKAFKYGEQALDMARQKKFPEYEALALKDIGTIHLFLSNYDKSENYFNAAIKIFNILNNQKGLSGCYNNLGLVLELKGEFTLALSYYHKSLEINRKINNKSGIASSLTNIGNILQKQGNYKSSVEYYVKSLKIREELNEKIGIADAYNNIGALYEKQNAFEEAIKNYQKALVLYVAIDEKPKSAMVLNNIGIILKEQKQYENSLEYYQQALKIREDYGDKQGVASSLLNIGEVYKAQKKYKEAFENFTRSQEIFKEIGNRYGVIQVKVELADYYLVVSNFNESINQIEYLVNTKEILPEHLMQAFNILSKAYAKKNNYVLAYKYQDKYLVLKDSLGNEENMKKILQIQLQYEFDKKQQEIEIIQEKQRLNDSVRLNNRKLVIFILIICLIAFLFIGLLIYRSYRIKKQDNFILELQKKEIEDTNEELKLFQEELISQKENLEVQKNLVMIHRDKIAEQNQKITDSIQYAKRIQNSILPPEELFSNSFTDYFILFKPKDIVSGDFYWLKETDSRIFIAVADCTGHGVPGAFMSLLGMSFLNEIVESGMVQSSEILSKVRDRIKNILRYQINKQESKDGMDIALCVVDKIENEIQFSGAYHSLLILRKNGENNPHLIEIKGDKMPVGAHFKLDRGFTVHQFKIEKTDKFYMFTDGFIDQFGGAYDRKFLPKRFKEILIKTGNDTMYIQKNELINNLDNWMEQTEQIDDILVIGFSLNNNAI